MVAAGAGYPTARLWKEKNSLESALPRIYITKSNQQASALLESNPGTFNPLAGIYLMENTISDRS